MSKLPISLVIITKNEERNIERCIRSAGFVEDIVVVDSGSEDRTVELARRLGARVSVEPWRGFAKQKIRATALARFDWVLSLDADEALSPEAEEKIRALFQDGEPTADAYSFPRVTYHIGKWMWHSGMYPDRQTRLFHRGRAQWKDVEVHEHIVAAKVEKFETPILHWAFNDIAHQIQTINHYSSLQVGEFRKSGNKFSRMKMIKKTIGKFIEAYFFQRGFRDGVPGLIVSMTSAFATFLHWAKLYELEVRAGERKTDPRDRPN